MFHKFKNICITTILWTRNTNCFTIFGRRAHDFFLPNGSKILVGSYTNLRREGLEGYISPFNNMVKDCWSLMGYIGVEVLPFVPVVYKGIDSMGGELLGGVRNWIEWISVQKGR